MSSTGNRRLALHCAFIVAIAGAPLAVRAQTAADTARLAAGAGFLETGGLKVGMSLKDVVPAARALNPQMQLTNTENVTVWPPNPSNMTETAPSNAPVSSRVLNLQTIQGRTPTANENVVVTLAMHPSVPVVTTIKRTLFYPEGTGPNYSQILEAIQAKFGPATETIVLSDSAALRMSQLRWYFDKNGKLMPPIVPNSFAPCGDNMTNCTDRSMFSLGVSASGSGIVKSMDYHLGHGPLALSAQQSTDAYLKSVDDERTRRQNVESKDRPLPKL